LIRCLIKIHGDNLKKKTKTITSDLNVVNIEILKQGIKITNKNINKLLPWNEITGKTWSFNVIHWSWTFHIRIKRIELNMFFPVSKNKIDLLELRRGVMSNLKRYKKGFDIIESKIAGPLKMQSITVIEE